MLVSFSAALETNSITIYRGYRLITKQLTTLHGRRNGGSNQAVQPVIVVCSGRDFHSSTARPRPSVLTEEVLGRYLLGEHAMGCRCISVQRQAAAISQKCLMQLPPIASRIGLIGSNPGFGNDATELYDLLTKPRHVAKSEIQQRLMH